MLVLDKIYMEMTMDFEEKVVVCALLLRFLKKKRRKMMSQKNASRPTS